MQPTQGHRRLSDDGLDFVRKPKMSRKEPTLGRLRMDKRGEIDSGDEERSFDATRKDTGTENPTKKKVKERIRREGVVT
jgi:hypothetical protein